MLNTNLLINAKKQKFKNPKQLDQLLNFEWEKWYNSISTELHLYKVGQVDAPGISTANNNDKNDDGQDKKVRSEDTTEKMDKVEHKSSNLGQKVEIPNFKTT